MKIRLILAGLSIFCLAIGLIYYRLGGMKEPAISRIFAPSYTIAGKTFQGKTHNNNSRFVDFQAELNADELLFSSDFVLIYDQNPNQALDSVTVFGGFLVQDTTQIPDGYEIKQVPAREVIRVEVLSHPLVAPSAPQVEEAIQNFAEERILKLQEGLLEKYIRNQQNQLIIEIAVQN